MSSSTSDPDLQSPVKNLTIIAKQRVFPLFLETVLLGVFTVQTAFFVYHRCGPGRREVVPSVQQRTHWRYRIDYMLSLAICLYVLLLIFWAMDVVVLQQELLVLMPGLLSLPLDIDAIHGFEKLRGMEKYAQAVLQVLIWTAGDCVALWRAYVVLGQARWKKILIPALLFIDFGAYGTHLIYYLCVSTGPPRLNGFLWDKTSGSVSIAPFMAALSVTAAMQLISTCLIAYKAWTIWKNRKGFFKGPGRMFRTLAAFIESGTVYTSLWVWCIVGSNDLVIGTVVAAWTDHLMLPMAAMYPSLVVMIVTLRDSVLVDGDNMPPSAPRYGADKQDADGEPVDGYFSPAVLDEIHV
ncbi:hypothetical protein PENSPDRAFT_738953 [Peniophora sp. CONT]|nr:hypothetical protein PENSPDRAFT_738953 [Peniophora sp. CONT]